MNTRRNRGYSPNVNMPTGTQRPQRGAWGIVLAILLPPIGLMYLWRNNIFQTRGRMLITALVTVEMAVIAAMFMPGSEIATTLPMPGVPDRIGPAPESNVLTALSNMDQLLREQQVDNPLENLSDVNPVAQQERLAAQQDTLNTMVYAIYSSSANYYHSDPNCSGQNNGRVLSVREAVQEGLGACPNCNPPAYTYKTPTATEAPVTIPDVPAEVVTDPEAFPAQ